MWVTLAYSFIIVNNNTVISQKIFFMNTTRLILALAIIVKLALSVLISSYFWNATTLMEIKQLPIYILILAVAYIGLQMLTRKLSGIQNWWDWVYYVGLLSIMIPAMLANAENFKLYHAITNYGTLCLILPVLVDGYYFVNKSGKN